MDKVDDDIGSGSGGDFGPGCRLNSDLQDQRGGGRNKNGVFIQAVAAGRFDPVR